MICMKKGLFIMTFVVALMGSLFTLGEMSMTGTVVAYTPVEEGPPIEVYFCPKDNCSSVLVKYVRQSKKVRCAFYDMELPSLVDALNDRDHKVIMDSGNANRVSGEVKHIDYDVRNNVMHNKFCIFDDAIVLTGSMNPTKNGDTKNNNNIVVVHSPTLAFNYIEEFDELDNRIFGKGDKVSIPSLIYNNGMITNLFCPEDRCKNHVIKALRKAEKSIHFMTFSFTDRDIARVLISMNENIPVEGLMERQRINAKYNMYRTLVENGVKIHTDTNKAFMHHKVFIIDGKTVITGSYNPTTNGNIHNDENILIIEDSSVAQQFLEEYRRLTKTLKSHQ